MLNEALTEYVKLRRAAGYHFVSTAYKLRSFVAFAQAQGDTHIRMETVLKWAALAPSPEQRYKRILAVRRFAQMLHAGDPRNEVPAPDALGRKQYERHPPHIFSQDEIVGLLRAAAKLRPADSIRPVMYATLFGLLAATGLRISEALALRREDVTEDGLTVRITKFKKSRIVPLHETTRQALVAYMLVRNRHHSSNDSLFINTLGGTLDYCLAKKTFRQLAHMIGLRERTGHRRPRIHDLRHTFAVRSLEQCGHGRDEVANHMAALSTYLGHVGVSTTYWYLEAAPALMRQIAGLCEAQHQGGAA